MAVFSVDDQPTSGRFLGKGPGIQATTRSFPEITPAPSATPEWRGRRGGVGSVDCRTRGRVFQGEPIRYAGLAVRRFRRWPRHRHGRVPRDRAPLQGCCPLWGAVARAEFPLPPRVECGFCLQDANLCLRNLSIVSLKPVGPCHAARRGLHARSCSEFAGTFNPEVCAHVWQINQRYIQDGPRRNPALFRRIA